MDYNNEYSKFLYGKLLKEYGWDIKALDWGSREGQEFRFKILSEIGISEGDTILDVGCGLGDFYSWLVSNGININYTGLDVATDMIKAARSKYPDLNFQEGDAFEFDPKETRFDYVFASGLFAHLVEDPVEYMKKTISQIFSLCRKGVAFNSLSACAEEKDPQEFFADPFETSLFCKTLTPWITLRHDYAPHDFTVYMYRDSLFERTKGEL